MQLPSVLKFPWYGFDHNAVAKKFGGDLTFLNEFCVFGEYNPVAVYRAAKPDESKGHKRYMLLQTDPVRGGGIVRGMTEEEMEKYRYQSAILCHNCSSIIYSVNRHDYHPCACKDESERVCIDGGKDYFRCIFGEKAFYAKGRLDLLTDIFQSDI